jgi:two-component system sensor histidine kinase VicK
LELDNLRQRIAELEATERSMQLRIDELTDFIENASLPLHWVNGSGIVIWANQVELDLLGYKKEEFINQHIGKFHADREVIEDLLARLLNRETLINFPARLKCKNGEIKQVLINSNVLWDGNEFIHTRCFTRDITDMKNEDAKKAQLIVELVEQIRKLTEENKLLKAFVAL